MNEASLKGAFSSHLRRNGWIVFNFNDRRTAGIPDTAASWDGRTWWIESKVVKRKSWPVELDPMEWIRGREAQLAQMVRLSHLALATYLVFVVVRGEWRALWFAPELVFDAVDTGHSLPLSSKPPAVTFDRLLTDLVNGHPPL